MKTTPVLRQTGVLGLQAARTITGFFVAGLGDGSLLFCVRQSVLKHAHSVGASMVVFG